MSERVPSRFKTLKAVKKAMDDGRLSKKLVLNLDNDCASITEPKGEYGLEYIWHGDDPYACAEQALDALGIRWKHV
ncbi:MAG: hypothetical protein ACYTEX_11150 [Planctomycetota bacterium]|jgi:hypothetical protein